MVSLLIIHRKRHPLHQRADEIAKFLKASDMFAPRVLLSSTAKGVTPKGRLPFMWLTDIMRHKIDHKITFDVCWTDELSVAAFSKELRIFGIAKSFVYDDPDFFPTHYSGLSKLILYSLELRTIRNADLIISCSEELGRLRIRQKARKVEVVPHGVNYQMFRKAYETRIKRISRYGLKPTTLIYAGTLRSGYAMNILPNVLKKVVDKRPDTMLLLTGYGLSNSISKKFDELGIANNVKFLGRVPYERLPDFFGAADIGLATYVTSVSAAYGVPLKIKEYMAAGLPVVATDFRPLAKFINSAKAGIVASANAEELAAAILNLLELPREKYVDLSTRATEYARSFGWRNLLERYESLLVK